MINMVKGFVGVGILALPSGFAKSGWLGGLIFFLVCGLVILYLSLKMIEVADKRNSKARSICEFSEECLGEKSFLIVNVFLFGIQIGICIAYVIFFSTYFQESLCFFVNYNLDKSICGSRIPSLLISLVLVTPSIFVRRMSKLKHWSVFANGLILICLLVIFVSSMFKMSISYITSKSISAIQWSEISGAVGLFIFAFEGTTLYFEIRHSMKDPRQFKTVLKLSLGFGLIAYGLIGLSGYLAFGSNVRDVILFNFPMDNPLYVFIQIFYCIAVLLSYPLQMFPVINIVELKLLETLKLRHFYVSPDSQEEESSEEKVSEQEEEEKENEKEEDEKNIEESHQVEKEVVNQNVEVSDQSMEEGIPDHIVQSENKIIRKQFFQQSIALRIAFLLFVFIVAVLFKRLSVFLNLIGSIAGCFFCFILPVIIYEKSMPEAPRKIILLHRAFMIMGIIFSFFGTLTSIFDMFS